MLHEYRRRIHDAGILTPDALDDLLGAAVVADDINADLTFRVQILLEAIEEPDQLRSNLWVHTLEPAIDLLRGWSSNGGALYGLLLYTGLTLL